MYFFIIILQVVYLRLRIFAIYINKNINTLLSNLENKLQKDISPISDFRGTSEYRNQVINNSFTKLYRLLSNNSEINNIMEVGHG